MHRLIRNVSWFERIKPNRYLLATLTSIAMIRWFSLLWNVETDI
jgi:hypothetical protein